MLNAAVKTLGLHDGPEEKCSKAGTFGDPENCSVFLTCQKGMSIINPFLRFLCTFMLVNFIERKFVRKL